MKNDSTLKVHKHNDLIQARYETMTMPEQLLLLAVIGQSDPRKLTAETPVEITVSNFCDLLDLNTGRHDSYDQLKKAVNRLYDRSVIIKKPDPNNPNLTEMATRWVHAVNYFDGEGRIQLFFSPYILPYLSNLKSNYTSFFIRHVSQFKSSYGIRLYELLIQWQSKGSREFEIDWLRKLWGLETKYKAIKDLKKDVINPAMKDINQHSNLWVKFGQRKQGRRVVAFQFHFGLKKSEADPKKLTQKQAEALARTGETYEQLHKRLKYEGYNLEIKKFK